MNIRKMVAWAASVMMLILVASGLIGTVGINDIRMGGTLESRSRQASAMVADIVPPTQFVMGAYLEAAILVKNSLTVDDVERRVTALKADYEQRHQYWLQADIDPAVKRAITTDMYETAKPIWAELQGRMIPAARMGDEATLNESFAELTRLYEAHREKADAAIALAQEYRTKLDDSATLRMRVVMVLLGVLALVLLALIGGFCTLVATRIVRPLTGITQRMQGMAAGHFATEEAAELKRSDEIGDVARALQGIMVYVEDRARQDAQAQMAVQEKVVSALGIALSRLKQGGLGHRIDENFPSEYEKLRHDYNEAAAAIHDVLGQIRHSVDSLTGSAAEIHLATQDLSERTEQQAASLEETAAAVHALTERVRETATAANSATSTVNDTEREVQGNAGMVQQAVEAMKGIEQSSRGIVQITDVIDALAFQTNLLSLNASVEAARAGEAGRSFAVVAEEVRALAQRSATAAKDIKKLIHESTRQVEGGVKLVGQSGEALGSILRRVTEVNGLIGSIAGAAQDQAAGLGEVNAAVGGLDRATQQNAAMGEECNAAARVLNGEAERLNQLILRFDLRTGADLADYVPADEPKAASPAELGADESREDTAEAAEREAA